MDKLTDYPKLISHILNEYIKLSNRHPNPSIETFLIISERKNHFFNPHLGKAN